ncbi:hypothetical protein ACIBTZ_03810 [Micromonospora sp. NPDC049460]
MLVGIPLTDDEHAAVDGCCNASPTSPPPTGPTNRNCKPNPAGNYP